MTGFSIPLQTLQTSAPYLGRLKIFNIFNKMKHKAADLTHELFRELHPSIRKFFP
jgi:hypothetical protein